jgi:AcrR family transcriptional regulator
MKLKNKQAMSNKDTKSIILESSFRLFLDQGYSNTSMSDLVNETRLSKGAFYHHFRNKEQLYHEVINRFFISYYDQLDWNSFTKLNLTNSELKVKEFFMSFIPQIVSYTKKGMSRYFILFFEAYDTYPAFRKTVRVFYEQLKSVFIEKYKEENVSSPEQEAINLIAKYEGYMFWISVFPEQKIENLHKEID